MCYGTTEQVAKLAEAGKWGGAIGAFRMMQLARWVATEAYAYASMMQPAAAQPGSRIFSGGGVGSARAQIQARRLAASSSPGFSPVWTASLPGSMPSSASSSSSFLCYAPDFVFVVVGPADAASVEGWRPG